MATFRYSAPQPPLIKMVRIQADTFSMGKPMPVKGEANEYPLHVVSTGAFEIGTIEVTQAQFEKVMGYNPSKNKSASKPVERVSWFDAIRFCNKLSEMEGLKPCYTMDAFLGYQCNFEADGYRLPTEAEWELASGKTSKEIPAAQVSEYAWHASNSKNETKATGLKKPNASGLYDVYGNVWEWCYDFYGEDYFSQSPVSSPKGPETGNLKVLKGGAMDADPQLNRSSYRYRLVPEYTSHNIGFRVARTVKVY
ncbi:formylglycine-generating enzyme family protein [Rhodocytophaga rosea]|uniref:Formylglycine-generating enzyme family protein n=1 Tax=Rhodocytophaga rosea TaxID=2704465 RepID=A0A6C0GEP6_9BACT|nr:SUMF1/EgtB/PvdO family nonheme iron enzyme [Rhodocytophaga rosea]QHT66140.1 formylglycine-generating enzyme family protein [Rhodocytophaga rosea]